MGNEQDDQSTDVIALLKAQLAEIDLTLQASLQQLQMCQKRLADTASRFQEFGGEEPPASSST